MKLRSAHTYANFFPSRSNTAARTCSGVRTVSARLYGMAQPCIGVPGSNTVISIRAKPAAKVINHLWAGWPEAQVIAGCGSIASRCMRKSRDNRRFYAPIGARGATGRQVSRVLRLT